MLLFNDHENKTQLNILYFSDELGSQNSNLFKNSQSTYSLMEVMVVVGGGGRTVACFTAMFIQCILKKTRQGKNM